RSYGLSMAAAKPETRHPIPIEMDSLFVSYPKLISKAAQSFVRVDGNSKLDKEKATSAAFLKARSRWGLISDAVRLARAWR
ncbi:hypothetical protein ACCS69_35100, partial [Rhizobium johnstonii]